MDVASGTQRAQMFASAIEIGLFDKLAKAPLSSKDLASELNIKLRQPSDFFDALVSLGLLNKKDNLYSNTPET